MAGRLVDVGSAPASKSIMIRSLLATAIVGAAFVANPSYANDDLTRTFKVFQFPKDQIPRIDGDFSDWDLVPESYVVGTDELTDNDGRHPAPDPSTIDVKVKVGWVEGLNRLYFMYEAFDNYWDYSLPGLHNDMFEVIVDADVSAGPLIDIAHRDIWTPEFVGARASIQDPRIPSSESHWNNHGVHAQNYHIMTPSVDKDWAMAWGSNTWIKEFPHANAVEEFSGEPGQPGKYRLEFWITPYDYAGPEGVERAVESVLRENKLIGLGWIILDYDDVDDNAHPNAGFWTLSRERPSFALASELPLFRLMPIEADLQPQLEARYSWSVVDMDRRMVAFKDESIGEVTSWLWDFGDGTTSTEQNPIHIYEEPGGYVTILDVTGPDGTSRLSKVWDVQLR